MKTTRFLLTILTIFASSAAFGVEVVKKVPDSTYSRLWQQSPFTTKPEVIRPRKRIPSATSP